MSGAAQLIRDLRVARRLEEACAAIEAAPLAELKANDPAAAASILTDHALIHAEYGRHLDAQECYEEAAALSSDPWLRAEAFVHEAQAARTATEERLADLSLGIPGELDSAAVNECLEDGTRRRRGIEDRITQSLGQAPDSESCAALHWARGTLDLGLGADSPPLGERRSDAQQSIAAAEEQSPTAWRPAFASLRLARGALRATGTNIEARLEEARSLVAAVRARADELTDHPWSLQSALDYENARIELAAWKWEEARKLLRHGLGMDPGHQAANVWLVYCDRMADESYEHLVRVIGALLGDGSPSSSSVVEPTLVAELRTERAALVEPKQLETAYEDYVAALRVRPTMLFARRGVVRCLAEQGRPYDSIVAAKVGLALEAALAPADPPPAPLLVELARVYAAERNEKCAEERFDEAEKAQPSYLFTYSARVAALRNADQTADALEAGARALESGAMGMGGVRTEIGYTHLVDRHYDAAIESFEAALADDDSRDVHVHARIGIVTVYRLRRRLRLAKDELTGGGATLQALGWLRAEVGDYGGALSCFEKAHEQAPRDSAVIISLTRVLRQLGRPHAALSFLEEQLPSARPARQDRILNEAAWTQLELGDIDGAKERFRMALELSPAFEPALRGSMAAAWRSSHSQIALREGIERAEVALERNRKRKRKRKSDLAPIYNEAGLCCVRAGDLASGRDYFERALALVDEGQPELSDILLVMQANCLIEAAALADADARMARVEARALPLRDDPRATLLRARYRYAAGDYDGALGLYSDALLHWDECGLARVGLAATYFALREYKAAADELGKLTTQGPAVRELLAWTYVKRHERGDVPAPSEQSYLERAAALCQKALDLEPRHAGAYECLGTIALLSSQFAAADAYTSQAVAIDADRVEAHRNRAAVHLRVARYGEAIDCLKCALGCGGPQSLTHLLLGFAYSQSGREADAIHHLRSAVALDRRDALAPELLATVLERGGDFNEAAEVLTRALAGLPRRDAARAHLGLARILCGQAAAREAGGDALLERALREAEEGLSIARELPSSPQVRSQTESAAHYHRGLVLHRLGREPNARSAFEDACRIDDQNGAAARALTLLGEARGQADGNEGRTRKWGNALGVLGILAALGAIVLAFATAGWHASKFEFFPAFYVVGGGLFVTLLGAALPRLAGVQFGGQVEIRISEQRAVEPVSVTLVFERGDALPPTMMAGPGAIPSTDLPHDVRGDPG